MGILIFKIYDDLEMSSTHFRITCHEGRCRIADLNSTNGTSLNGGTVSELEVLDGDRVRAGRSCVSVHIQHTTPSPPPSLARQAVMLHQEPADAPDVPVTPSTPVVAAAANEFVPKTLIEIGEHAELDEQA